jgi:predicted transcriptional regulator
MGNTTFTVRVSPELKERLGKLAERTRRTKSFLAGKAIAGYVEREFEIVAGIERGLANMKAGRVVRHEEVMAEIDVIVEAAKSRRGTA